MFGCPNSHFDYLSSGRRPFIFRARLAQSVEHETLNLGVVGSSPTLGDNFFSYFLARIYGLDKSISLLFRRMNSNSSLNDVCTLLKVLHEVQNCYDLGWTWSEL